MKKLFILGIAFGGLLAVASCKKDYTCHCDVVSTGLIEATFSADTVFTDVKKGDAEEMCTGLNSTVDAFGTTVTTTCELE